MHPLLPTPAAPPSTGRNGEMDIVSLLNPQARARRNALRSLRSMQTRREDTVEVDRAVADAAADAQSRRRRKG